MYYVYLLTHKYCVESNEKDGDIYANTKVLGVYSRLKKARGAIDFFSALVGFCDYKDDFYIRKMKLYGKENSSNTVHLIEYERFLYDDLYTYDVLGICADEQTANEMIEKARQNSHHDESTEEYDIIEYELDKHSEYWGEGFDS